MDEKSLNELLECSVCLESLDHNNKVLPCQHTFCKKCLQDIVASKQELLCPECRILVTTPIDDLPSNILLARLLEGLNSRKRKLLSETHVSPKRAKTETCTHPVPETAEKHQNQNIQNLEKPSISGTQTYDNLKIKVRLKQAHQKSSISRSECGDLNARKNGLLCGQTKPAEVDDQNSANQQIGGKNDHAKRTVNNLPRENHVSNKQIKTSDEVAKQTVNKGTLSSTKTLTQTNNQRNSAVHGIPRTTHASSEQLITNMVNQMRRRLGKIPRLTQALNNQSTRKIDQTNTAKQNISTAAQATNNQQTGNDDIMNPAVHDMHMPSQVTQVTNEQKARKHVQVSQAGSNIPVALKDTRKRKLSFDKQVLPKQAKKECTISKVLDQQKNTQVLDQPSTSGTQKNCSCMSENRLKPPDKRSNLHPSKSKMDKIYARMNAILYGVNNSAISAHQNTKRLSQQHYTGKNDQAKRTDNDLSRAQAIKRVTSKTGKDRPTMANFSKTTQGRNNKPTQNSSVTSTDVHNIQRTTHATNIQPFRKNYQAAPSISNNSKTTQMNKNIPTRKHSQANQVLYDIDRTAEAINKQVINKNIQAISAVQDITMKREVTNEQQQRKNCKANHAAYSIHRLSQSNISQPSRCNFHASQAACNFHRAILATKTLSTRKSSPTLKSTQDILKTSETVDKKPLQVNEQLGGKNVSRPMQNAQKQPTTNNNQINPTFGKIPVAVEATNRQPTRNYDEKKTTINKHMYVPKATGATDKQPTRNNEHVKPISKYKNVSSSAQATSKQLTRDFDQARAVMSKYTRIPKATEAVTKQQISNNDQVKALMGKYSHVQKPTDTIKKWPTNIIDQVKPTASNIPGVKQATNKQPTSKKDKVKAVISKCTYVSRETEATNKWPSNNDQEKPNVRNILDVTHSSSKPPISNDCTVKPTMSNVLKAREATNKQQTSNDGTVNPVMSKKAHVPKATEATIKQQIRNNDQVKPTISNISCVTQATYKQTACRNDQAITAVHDTPRATLSTNIKSTRLEYQAKTAVDNFPGTTQSSSKQPTTLNKHINDAVHKIQIAKQGAHKQTPTNPVVKNDATTIQISNKQPVGRNNHFNPCAHHNDQNLSTTSDLSHRLKVLKRDLKGFLKQMDIKHVNSTVDIEQQHVSTEKELLKKDNRIVQDTLAERAAVSVASSSNQTTQVQIMNRTQPLPSTSGQNVGSQIAGTKSPTRTSYFEDHG